MSSNLLHVLLNANPVKIILMSDANSVHWRKGLSHAYFGQDTSPLIEMSIFYVAPLNMNVNIT